MPIKKKKEESQEVEKKVKNLSKKEKVEEILDLHFEESLTAALTIGGRVADLVGVIPVVGDIIEDENCTYEILELENNRIKKILCRKLENVGKEIKES